MKKLTIVVAVLLAGCATALNDQLAEYQGQPVQALVAKLGFPTAEQTIMGRKVYIWRNGGTYPTTETVTTSSTGYVGIVPVSTTSTGFVTGSASLACTIRVIVDDAERIQRWEWSGNNGPCVEYSSRLRR